MSPRWPGIDAVVFDLDDTLIDWWGSIERCVREFADDHVIGALQQHCRTACWEFRPGSNDVWHRNTWALHHHRHEHWPAALAFLDPADRDLLLKRFEEELWVGFFPDTVPTLDALLDDVRLAVLSNNQLLAHEVERLRLHDWFELAVSAPHEAPKPDPRPFLETAAALGLTPDRCIYVGDSVRTDVLGAHGAGMRAVWLNRWHDAWPERDPVIAEITTLADLPALLGR
jgi:HAD superfamily hydrolase (TIGR01549 family)